MIQSAAVPISQFSAVLQEALALLQTFRVKANRTSNNSLSSQPAKTTNLAPVTNDACSHFLKQLFPSLNFQSVPNAQELTTQAILFNLPTSFYSNTQGQVSRYGPQRKGLFNTTARRFYSKSSVNPIKYMQHKRLQRLEQEAIHKANDPTKQAVYYAELLNAGYPELIVDRIEEGKFASDEACLNYYVQALVRTNQTDKIIPKLSEQAQQMQKSDSNLPLSPIIHAAVGGNKKTVKLPEEVSKMSTSASLGGRVNPVHVVVEESRGPIIWRVFRSISVAFIYGFVILTVVGVTMESSGLLKAGPQQTEVEPSQSRTVKFTDVQGCDEAKDELEELVAFLKNPDKFKQLGGRMPKGVLLTGPPGTGKTLLARAVAGEAGVPFFFMSGSEFDEVYVGVGARRVRELFNAARKKSPSIVFIDELDVIGSKRNPKDQAYIKQTLNQLLVELDGFSQTEGVVVMGATNFPELLDKALIRPGRFDRHVNVPLPDVRGRLDILKLHSKEIQLASNTNLSVIARGTPGFSGADLQNLINQAAIQASREGSRAVEMKHLEYAKDKILMGAERKSAVITEESKRVTAYHEGGHALVAIYTPGAMPLHKATIMPRGLSLGMTVQLPEMDKDSFTKKEYMAMLDVCMGGRVAEEMIFGSENITSGAHNDIMKATVVAKRMVTQFGMSEKIGPVAHSDDDLPQLSSQTKLILEAEVRAFIEAAQTRATNVLKTHRVELDRLAKALMDYETLSRQEIEAVIKGQSIRR